MKPNKKANPPSRLDSAISFENAIQQLEKIVADMENAELPLEDVLKKYEEGTGLVRFCTQKLDDAEKKIELLQKKADGTVTLQPFAESEAAAAVKPEAAADDTEAKLF